MLYSLHALRSFPVHDFPSAASEDLAFSISVGMSSRRISNKIFASADSLNGHGRSLVILRLDESEYNQEVWE